MDPLQRDVRYRVAAYFLAGLLCTHVRADAQTARLPFAESFDTVAGPSLPAGWTSSRNRAAGADDFTLSTTAPRTSPHCVATLNATIPQWLASPVFNFTGAAPGTMTWYTRRSSTFNARLICEASLDSGSTFTLSIGDTLAPTGSTAYVRSDVVIPAGLTGGRSVRFRWRVLPDITGTSGTLRMDDFSIGAPATGDSVSRGVVVINEIMYEPVLGEPEWVELMNTGGSDLNLRDWTIADATSVRHPIVTTDCQVSPGGLVVVTGDSAALKAFDPMLTGNIVEAAGFPALNDEGDNLVIGDVRGAMVDSVPYLPSWHNPAVRDAKGRSLERILAHGASSDGSNWTTCVVPRGGTPGKANSAAERSGSATVLVSCSPNPFSPDNDGKDDVTVVHYLLPDGLWSLSIEVYDVRGRVIRRLANSVPATAQGDLIWDGRGDDRVRGRMGMYIVLLEAVEVRRGTTISGKTVVVLAGKL